jgi:HEPN domain-containing protein
MTKEEHINHWLESAEEEMKMMKISFREGSFAYALFFWHLHLEKICKALWIKYNEGNHPPRIHNLVSILAKTPIELDRSQILFLSDLNRFQLESRYSDSNDNLFKECTKEYATEMMSEAELIKKCLIQELQKR